MSSLGLALGSYFSYFRLGSSYLLETNPVNSVYMFIYIDTNKTEYLVTICLIYP